jgi:hypothetical protein
MPGSTSRTRRTSATGCGGVPEAGARLPGVLRDSPAHRGRSCAGRVRSCANRDREEHRMVCSTGRDVRRHHTMRHRGDQRRVSCPVPGSGVGNQLNHTGFALTLARQARVNQPRLEGARTSCPQRKDHDTPEERWHSDLLVENRQHDDGRYVEPLSPMMPALLGCDGNALGPIWAAVMAAPERCILARLWRLCAHALATPTR